ncbi:sugar ABC transporter permease [Vagococcus sp. BWB3-3]|uniref:Sugar ABC transporter permease n=1 Tax=Vagococcus allomyrinae TaxID=2794353 RepID=A0A940SW71_9ENTE|nr:sugar ABC transporter permease [Vagococcus allomyrinae]MBP1041083.1 sugar ABC transporter permease [Vagococcus allomyrinae]
MRLTQQKREKVLAWLFIAPAGLAFLVFMFWPVMYTLYLSLLKWNMVAPIKVPVGLGNYLDVLTDPVTLKLFANTALYMVLLMVLNFLIPYVFAFVNTFVMKRGKGVYKILLFMPSLISLVVGAIVLQWIFNPVSGPVGLLLAKIGITLPAWSKTKGLVIVVISLVAVFKTFGYNFLVLLSGMSNVSPELIEAARLEKTPDRQIFRRIVMPLTSSTAVYVLIMSIVQGLQYVFTPIKVLTQGGPNNASSNIIYGVYQEAFGYYNTGKASALSIMTLVVFVVLLLVEFKYVEKGVYYEN